MPISQDQVGEYSGCRSAAHSDWDSLSAMHVCQVRPQGVAMFSTPCTPPPSPNDPGAFKSFRVVQPSVQSSTGSCSCRKLVNTQPEGTTALLLISMDLACVVVCGPKDGCFPPSRHFKSLVPFVNKYSFHIYEFSHSECLLR